MIKCPNCDGTGREEDWRWHGDQCVWDEHAICSVCNGSGRVKANNFKVVTASLERLAEFLETVKNACFDCASRGPYKSPDCPFADAKDDPYKCNILLWLKQEADDGE